MRRKGRKRIPVRKVLISEPATPEETERIFKIGTKRSARIRALVDQVIKSS